MSVHDRGDLVRLQIELRDESGALRDPTSVELTIRAPDGALVSHETAALTHVSTGVYAFNLSLDEAGVYAYRWKTTGNPQVAEVGTEEAVPSIFDAEGPPAWSPSTEEVAAILRARVQKKGGFEGTDWDETTRPTKSQVERLIRMAVSRVANATVWNPCTFRLRSESRASAAMYASMLVEQSLWPESTTDRTSSFASLLKLWEGGLPDLKARITEDCPEGDEEPEDDESASHPVAQGHFDDGMELLGRDFPPPGWW